MTASRISLVWFTLACVAGTELGQLFAVPLGGSTELPALWPPTGLLAGALILSAAPGRRILPFITLAITCFSLIAHGRPAILSVNLCAIATVDACVVAWLVRRVIDRSFTMHRVADILVLVAAACAVPMVSGGLAGALLSMDGAPMLPAWRGWWLQETLGILFFAPVIAAVISEHRALRASLRSWRALEFVLVFAGGPLMIHGVFGELLPSLVSVPSYALPFLLWPAFRAGPGGTAAMSLAIALVALWHTSHGSGPFALSDPSPARWLLRAQGTMTIMSMSLLLFAGIIAERKRDAQERARLILELQQALMEIKTLRGLIPICAWCHKVRDDAGFWQKLETYLGAQTGATFSHAICPSCQEEAHVEIRGHSVELPLG